jgi:hypothetical protein
VRVSRRPTGPALPQGETPRAKPRRIAGS